MKTTYAKIYKSGNGQAISLKKNGEILLKAVANMIITSMIGVNQLDVNYGKSI
ncbi:hypothetical protein [Staphylococcus warneri]|uniref:hypothetical protein n=1 Tax=Staphylococcus warneri TaxID=1292 RepID=UPI0030BB294B